MKLLSDLDLASKRVLVRVDFNVPLASSGGEAGGTTITDDTRVRAALPTIQAVLAAGGTPILLSHLGRPKGEPEAGLSLRPVAEHLGTLIDAPVVFCDATVGDAAARCIRDAADGSVVLLENTRFLQGETSNDADLSDQLAALGDAFVLDAFGAAHRAHASTVGVAERLPSAAGLLLQREVEFLGDALESPERPFVAVVGGAKVSDKLGVLQALAPKVDRLLIGGAMAYTFLLARGEKIGDSLVERERLDDARALIDALGQKLVLPSDHVVADGFAADANPRAVTQIPTGTMALDIGPDARALYASIVRGARTVVWNGPMGVFEMEPFAGGTLAVAKALADATEGGALTVVGGGDSVAALAAVDLTDAVTHVSTGGGAMLELMEGKSLPGIEVLS